MTFTARLIEKLRCVIREKAFRDTAASVRVAGTLIMDLPPAPTQRGVDAVNDLGFDNTGVLDCAPLLQSFCDSLQTPTELHFSPGYYRFNTTVRTNQPMVRLIGDGNVSLIDDGAVTFFSDVPLASILWFNCDEVASNLQGPSILNIQFQDASPDSNVLGCAIRLTNTANSELQVGFLDMHSARYIDGSVNVEQGSTVVTGNDTEWTLDFTPAWIVIEGYPYEVTGIVDESTLQLAIAYQGDTATNLDYAINYHGIGVWCEPGLGFTQYGKDWILNGRVSCALFCSAGATSPYFTGTSRIKVKAGYLNGESLPDSMACYLGPFSDTVQFDVSLNSYAYGIVIANGHQHDIQHVDCENAGPPPPVTGTPNDYDSCYGILVMSDNPSDTYGNRLGGYFRQVGTGIELYGASSDTAPTRTVIGVATFRSNADNIVLGNATNTTCLVPVE